MSLFGELRLAEKKSHRKYSFAFSQYSLSYRACAKVVSALCLGICCCNNAVMSDNIMCMLSSQFTCITLSTVVQCKMSSRSKCFFFSATVVIFCDIF